MEGESRELSDAGDVGRRVGADGAQGQGLARGVGAGGDAVVHGGAEELLEPVVGFEVERGGLFVADQQSPAAPAKEKKMPAPERGRGAGMDLGL